MKSGVADRGEVDQNHVAVRLLQRHGGIDGGGGAARASLGAEESKDPRLARASRELRVRVELKRVRASSRASEPAE